MPFALILIGALFVVSGVRGKAGDVGEILIDDFSRPPSFIMWIVAVSVVGIVASFSQSRQLGNAFFTLLLVVLFLSNRGFFNQFTEQLKG